MGEIDECGVSFKDDSDEAEVISDGAARAGLCV